MYNQTRIAVEEADPSTVIMIDGPDVTSDVLDELAPQFAIAVGLVLVSDGLVDGDQIGVNLFQNDTLEDSKAILGELQSVGVVLLAVVMICAAVHIGFGFQVDKVRVENNGLQTKLSKIRKL